MSDVIRPGNVAVAEAPELNDMLLLPELQDVDSRKVAGWNRGVVCVLGAFLAALVALAAIWQLPAYDLFWQLKTGELILQSRSIPRADVFSFTAAGQPWVVQEWLAEVLFFLLFSRVSPEALVFLKASVIALAFLLVLARCWARTGQPLLAVGVTLWAAYAARGFLTCGPRCSPTSFWRPCC
jgi:hypothetical protein